MRRNFLLGNSCVFANFGLRRNSSAEPFRNETIAKHVGSNFKTAHLNIHFLNLNFFMNKGGFSWKKLIGISGIKSKISKKIGIPLTKSGRNQKIGKIVSNLITNSLNNLTKSK